jgi:ubiquinone/menaquinone biosynthesis C-methylase UbiE
LKSGSASHKIEWLLSLGTSFQASQVLFESVRLGLFDLLGGAALPSCDIAARLKLAPEAIERLVRVLLEMNILVKRGQRYDTAALAKKYLCTDSPLYIGDYFMHRQSLQQPWSELKTSLKTNFMVMPNPNRLADYPQQLKRFTGAMDALGRLKCERIMARLRLRDASRMLDLGGGMGTYALGFCSRSPGLEAVVFDLPDVARLARKAIKKCGLQDRVAAVAGQCFTDPLPTGPFDFVFISNLLHIYNIRDCRHIIKKAAGVLAKGGTLVVHDYIFGCGDSVSVSLFDMTMLIGTPQGRCYEKAEISRWLRAVGMRKIASAEILAGTSILWGVKS